MKYSSIKLDTVEASASVLAAQKARELREAGHDVISLAAGEPDFPTPEHVIEAGIAAMRAGDTGYTDVIGTVALREAIRRKFKRDNALDFALNEIIVGPGAKSLIATILQTTLNPGDEVIIPTPSWVSYVDITKLADGVPVAVATSEEHGLKLDPATLEAAITPRTRWLMLNSPGNPTGAVFSMAELSALAEVLRRHPQVMVFSDEIYEYLVFGDTRFVSFLEAAPDLRNRVVTVNGASKGYAMTGWRIGYAAAPTGLVKAMSKTAGQLVGPPCSISQAATIAALDGPQDYLTERAADYARRCESVLTRITAIPGLSAQRPEGAFYLYVNCAGLFGRTTPTGKVLASDTDVVDFLLEEALVVTVTGEAYGLSPYFRISIASALTDLEAACERIAAAVAKLA